MKHTQVVNASHPPKRKREPSVEDNNKDDDDDDGHASLSRMKQFLASERDVFLSDIDDLVLSLNLLQLKPDPKTCGSCQQERTEARDGKVPIHRSTRIHLFRRTHVNGRSLI